ncbi:unnamed protein product, partial [marine sediment metagenome]
PEWLWVRRQNGGNLLINDWKFEGGQWFCPVGIAGGPYDATDPNQKGPFTLSLASTNPDENLETFILSGVGWDHNTNHRHPNAYVSLSGGQPEPPPEPPEPPPEPPPDEVKVLLLAAKADLVQAILKIDQALELLP